MGQAALRSIRILAVLAAMSLLMWLMLRGVVAFSGMVDFGFYGNAATGIVALLAASPLLVALHEAGHAFVAEAAGWHVRVFAVMGLSIRPSPWRAAYGPPVSGPFSAGSVFAVPPQGSWRYGWIAFSAGGPLANLLFAALAFVTAQDTADGSLCQAMLYVVGAISLYQGIWNLIPRVSADGSSTDGAHILAGIYYRDIERRLDRAMRLYGETVSGVRPRNWSDDLIQSLRMDALWSRNETVHRMLFQYYFDRGMFDAARTAIARAGEFGAGGAMFKLEEAYFLAFHDNAPGQARAVVSGVTGHHIQRLPIYWRTAAAVALAEGNFTQARNSLNTASRLYRDWLLTTDADRDAIAALELRIRDLGRPLVLSPVAANVEASQ